MTTVLASGKLRSRITASGLMRLARSLPFGEVAPGPESFSQLYLTSSAVSGRLLVGGRGSYLLFCRSLSVIVSLSGETSHEAAASPSSVPSASLPFSPFLYDSRRWYMWLTWLRLTLLPPI